MERGHLKVEECDAEAGLWLSRMKTMRQRARLGTATTPPVRRSGTEITPPGSPQPQSARAKGNEIHTFIASMEADGRRVRRARILPQAADIRALLPVDGPGDRRGTRAAKLCAVPATRCVRTTKYESRPSGASR